MFKAEVPSEEKTRRLLKAFAPSVKGKDSKIIAWGDVGS
jgi:hypothetical protein